MAWVLCAEEEEESVAFSSLVSFLDSLEGKKQWGF